MIFDHDQRVSILRELINEYNVVRANTPRVLPESTQTSILTCIVCRINEILSPYIANGYQCPDTDRLFITSAVLMMEKIKSSMNITNDYELISKAKTSLKSKNTMNANAKPYIPRNHYHRLEERREPP